MVRNEWQYVGSFDIRLDIIRCRNRMYNLAAAVPRTKNIGMQGVNYEVDISEKEKFLNKTVVDYIVDYRDALPQIIDDWDCPLEFTDMSCCSWNTTPI